MTDRGELLDKLDRALSDEDLETLVLASEAGLLAPDADPKERHEEDVLLAALLTNEGFRVLAGKIKKSKDDWGRDLAQGLLTRGTPEPDKLVTQIEYRRGFYRGASHFLHQIPRLARARLDRGEESLRDILDAA